MKESICEKLEKRSIASFLFNDPRGLSTVIIIFTGGVCVSVPTFQNLVQQNKFQAQTVISTGWTVGLGLVEGIIANTNVFLLFLYFVFCYAVAC